ncbi:MAG: radical SAM protein [Clostridia bacterium]|nr:radical SAM protein [Clostridia bacterium]
MLKASKFNLVISENNGKTALYNTRTGSLIRVSKAAYERLSSPMQMHQAQQDARVMGFLRRGFLVPEAMDESAAFYAQYRRFLDMEAQTVGVTAAVTLGCNYRCRYCFESDVLQSEASAASPDALCAFIEKAAQALTDCQTISVKWFGGEPLLDFEYILSASERLLRYCEQNGIHLRTRIITNGALLTDAMLEKLKRFNLVSIQITLDGTKETYCTYKGASEQDYDAVFGLIDRQCGNVLFNLRLNCYPANLSSLIELTDELYSRPHVRDRVNLYLAPVQSCAMETFDPEDYADAHLRFVEHLYALGWHSQVRNALIAQRSSPCDNLKPEGFIADYAGNLYACEGHIGNACARIASFDDAMAYIQEQKQAQLRAYEQSLTQRCKSCAYFPMCFSGCPAHRRSGSGCAAFQKMVRGILEINARISG